IWINIDDDESHYLKILCDEVFGRDNFVTTIVWQKFHSVKSNAEYNISKSHDNIIVYVRKPNLMTFNKLPMSEEALKVYKNPDNDPRGKWRTAPLTVSLLGGARGASYARTGISNGLYEIIAPNGKSHKPTTGRCWFSKKKVEELKKDNRIWWGKDGNAIPMEKIFLSEKGGTKTISTFWNHKDFGSNKKANEEMKILFPDNSGGELNFSTPKPEKLMSSIINIASNKNDIVLDFFAGSGTTASVAHKMNRKFITCEQMDYVENTTIERLKKVITGEQGGISKDVDWQGGGSFTYCELTQHNANIIDKIEQADTTEALKLIWHEIEKTDFISYKIRPETINENIHEFE
ncbi:type III restriction endonuclease subunit M, partial [Methylococcaceae bacterium HT4]